MEAPVPSPELEPEVEEVAAEPAATEEPPKKKKRTQNGGPIGQSSQLNHLMNSTIHFQIISFFFVNFDSKIESNQHL